ncbi:hypothetical protein [Photobacterium lucens]|uniref:hypothetical protein n=1 Tax=Photobacterium lucens TaxID=2562949 RepID=UPI0006B569DD|nr:hypothetical protein [Photobacterium lucens]KPA54145.1 hypothetical protein VT25_03660 [Photobacterium leiognathi subsp. mandapamensis]MBP2698958.1 hypothetical protein [Vibrio parahaemolyticus]MZG55924.1 hypothetical protein [Photobacterium lucens]MZG80390.1 hypothetical protein [Photobacterium lucens]
MKLYLLLAISLFSSVTWAHGGHSTEDPTHHALQSTLFHGVNLFESLSGTLLFALLAVIALVVAYAKK